MKNEKTNILIVDDDRSTAELLSTFLKSKQFDTVVASSAAAAIELLNERHFPIVVSDISLQGPNGLTLLPYVTRSEKPSVIMFVTAHGSLDTAVKAIGEGAFEYIGKTERLREDLLQAVERAVKHLDSLSHHTRTLSESLVEKQVSIIGKAPSMVKLYRVIAKAALSGGNVLVTGESGTGKELVAHAIHDNGPWREEPFITVNCGALTETLLESELFGHVRGAFTGAIANKKGLFEEANEGTLFLDEIGDISLALQVKLLRAIQEGEIKPVGSSETRRVKVRIIAATHRNLEQQIRESKFREDLYYRLKVFLLDIPPLRERREDIPDLVNYFIARLGPQTTPRVESISDEALQLLVSYDWPGNIRELENAIERAIGMANSNVIFLEDLPVEIISPRTHPSEIVVEPIVSVDTGGLSLEKVESLHIAKVLEAAHYNKSKAAEILGIDRGTLYRKATEYGIALKPGKSGMSSEA